MDKDNDGLDPVELLEFIQGNQEVGHCLTIVDLSNASFQRR